MSDTQVFVTPDAMTIEVIDRTSPSLEVSVDEKRVTVEGATRPVVNVSYTGGRGPIWLPGNTYNGTSLAAILAGYIGKAQLAQDLLADIDSTITGLVDARAELATAIQANVENGTRIDDVVSRITQAEGTLELSVAKLNAAEANISNAQVFIDDASVRLSAAEGSISNASNYIATQEAILSNEWTVKIQENNDGTACVAGTGLLVYPTWKLDTVYDIDDYSWFDGNAYKAIIAHTASEENVPPNDSYWQLIPYATKSQFGVLAESFFVQTGTGKKAIPFMVQDDQVMINGDLTVNGLIEAGALSSNKIWSWSIQSQNYEAGTSGYSINAITGHAEFNDLDMTINYSSIVDAPDPDTIVQTAIDNTLDTTAGGIIVRDSGLQRKAHLTGGDLEFYDYYDSAWHLYKSVTKTKTGVCTNGETVNLGYFRNQPNVVLLQFNTDIYNATYSNQSQKISIYPNLLRKEGNNWLFDAVCVLNLAQNSLSYNNSINLAMSPPEEGVLGYARPTCVFTSNNDQTYTSAAYPVSNNFPQNTRNVSTTIVLSAQARRWTGLNNQAVTTTTTITCTMQVYNGSDWVNLNTVSRSFYGTYLRSETIIISGSSDYDILKVRFVVRFFMASPLSGLTTLPYDPNAESTYIATFSTVTTNIALNASTISVNGQAMYMAIG